MAPSSCSGESLSELEDAIDLAIAAHCEQQSTAVTHVRGAHGRRDFTKTDGVVVLFRWTLIERDFRCRHCGYDTWDETYKVNDTAWRALDRVVVRTPIRHGVSAWLRVSGLRSKCGVSELPHFRQKCAQFRCPERDSMQHKSVSLLIKSATTRAARSPARRRCSTTSTTTVTLFVEVPSASHSVAAHTDTAGLDAKGR